MSYSEALPTTLCAFSTPSQNFLRTCFAGEGGGCRTLQTFPAAPKLLLSNFAVGGGQLNLGATPIQINVTKLSSNYDTEICNSIQVYTRDQRVYGNMFQPSAQAKRRREETKVMHNMIVNLSIGRFWRTCKAATNWINKRFWQCSTTSPLPWCHLL